MINESLWAWVTEARFASVCGGGQTVLTELLAALKRESWRENDIFGVHLAVEEAIVNAIRHGNRSDENKFVSVQCRLSSDRLEVEIADEGIGFDPALVPDCRATENLLRPGGRGILLMRNYMSRVDYTDGGHRVVMEKRRSKGH